MTSLHSFADHVSGLTAQTIQTRAHGFRTDMTRVRERDIASVPSQSFVRDPFTLSARRSHPHSGSTVLMNNRQSPFGIKFEDFVVGDEFSSQGIHDIHTIGSQNKLGSNPEQVCTSTKNESAQDFEKSLGSARNNNKTVGRKESEQGQRGARPQIVASRAKDLVHIPSIAGELK